MTNFNIETLRAELIVAFKPHYLLNDLAHQEDHFEEVFITGVEINNRLELGYPEHLIMYAAYLHDLFAWSRDNHHELSYTFVKGTCHPMVKRLSDQERELVADACLCHRASYKGEFYNAFSKLINSADRGRPTTMTSILDRAINYRISKNKGESRSEMVLDAIKHVKEKFGSKGYARYPSFYMACYKKELAELQQTIDEL